MLRQRKLGHEVLYHVYIPNEERFEVLVLGQNDEVGPSDGVSPSAGVSTTPSERKATNACIVASEGDYEKLEVEIRRQPNEVKALAVKGLLTQEVLHKINLPLALRSQVFGKTESWRRSEMCCLWHVLGARIATSFSARPPLATHTVTTNTAGRGDVTRQPPAPKLLRKVLAVTLFCMKEG